MKKESKYERSKIEIRKKLRQKERKVSDVYTLVVNQFQFKPFIFSPIIRHTKHHLKIGYFIVMIYVLKY